MVSGRAIPSLLKIYKNFCSSFVIQHYAIHAMGYWHVRGVGSVAMVSVCEYVGEKVKRWRSQYYTFILCMVSTVFH